MTGKRIKRVGWYGDDGKTRRGLPQATLNAFYREVEKLRAKYFVRDEDGDYPVAFEVFDRTYGGTPHYFQIPHLHGLPPDEYGPRLKEAVRYAHGNVAMASEDLRRIAFEVEEVLRKHKITEPR